MASATPGGRTDIAAASLTTSSTGLIVWAINQLIFNGDIPVEVYSWLQVSIPALAGFMGAVVLQARTGRHAAPPPAPPAPERP